MFKKVSILIASSLFLFGGCSNFKRITDTKWYSPTTFIQEIDYNAVKVGVSNVQISKKKNRKINIYLIEK